VPVGVEHRKAPERLPEAARTPWELRISSRRSAGPLVGERPWGADPKHHGSPRCGGFKRARGRAGAKAPATTGGWCASEGARKPWDHGRGTRTEGLKRLRVCGALDLVFLRVRGCRAPRTKGRRGAAMHHGLSARKGVTSENPRSGSGPSESARPEGEQPVEGVRNPEDGRCRVRQTRVNRISSAHVARGARNPRRGVPTGHGRRRHQGLNPEGAAKPVEAAGRSSDRADGRIAEDLAVVKTTRRERRTDDAATRSGALREARETP